MSYQKTRDLASKLQQFWQSNGACAQFNYQTNATFLDVISVLNQIADFEQTGFVGDLMSRYEEQRSLEDEKDFNLRQLLFQNKSRNEQPDVSLWRGTFSKTVFLSAGHSDRDSGAVNEALKLREENVVQDIRNRVAMFLRAMGVQVKTDGPDAENWERDRAIALAAQCNGVKIDFHLNAGPTKATGIEVFSDVQDKPFAQQLASTVQSVLSTPLRGDKGWKADTESQHGNKGLAWIRRLNNSYLIELAFLSNAADMQVFMSKRDELAKALAIAISEKCR